MLSIPITIPPTAMIIYVHILNTPYVVPFDYRPGDSAHIARLNELWQKLVATNLYSDEQLQNMFIPYTNQNPRLEDLKTLEQFITKTITALFYSDKKFKVTLHSIDGQKVTPFFGKQDKQFWLGYLKEYDTIYASVSY